MEKNTEQNTAVARLPFKVKAGFGIGDLGGNLFFTAMGNFSLIFLTDVVGIAAALAGIVLFITKIWDAIVDPFIGYFSDRTRSRWGRRRPFLLWGSLPMLLAMWLFFSTPDFRASQVLGCVWAAIALCLLNTAYSVVNIPYSSLTPELTKDYKERTSLNGYRFVFAVIGTILGAAAVLPIVGLGKDPHSGYSLMGLIFGVIMAATTLVTFFAVREPACEMPQPKQKILPTYMVVFKNGTYLRLALVYMLYLIALAFVQSMIVFYFQYIYGNTDMTTLALLILLGVAGICIPISVLVAKRIGKKLTFQIALFMLAVSCLAIFFFGHTLGMNFTLAVMIFAGIGIGFGYAPPFAMLPDVVEVDAVRTGNRKEGAYYGMWTFCAQLGVALSGVLAGILLDLAGYKNPEIAGQLVSQPDTALLMIRLLLGPIPAAVFIGGLLLIQRHPLDEKAYNAIIAGAKTEAAQ